MNKPITAAWATVLNPSEIAHIDWLRLAAPNAQLLDWLQQISQTHGHARRLINRRLREHADLDAQDIDQPLPAWLSQKPESVCGLGRRLGAMAFAQQIRATIQRESVAQIHQTLGASDYRLVLGSSALEVSGLDDECWAAAERQHSLPELLLAVGAAVLESSLKDAGTIAQFRLRLMIPASAWRQRPKSLGVDLAQLQGLLGVNDG